jgi:hypothetical protein
MVLYVHGKKGTTMQIEQVVLEKLEKAIDQLLSAGWGTFKIRDALAKQSSFGKYDGCTPEAILELANTKCRVLNAETARVNRELRNVIKSKLQTEYPQLRKYFRL